MRVSVVKSLDRVSAADWNRLAGTENPFTRHEFLAALEHHGCVGDTFGWWPQHILVREAGRLVGAAPLYLKDNSYGEFVFDWSWADAYQRAGLAYYPKLVVAVPYTPVTGPRLLVAPDADAPAVCEALLQGALEHAHRHGVSGLHWLFTSEEATEALEAQGLMRRVGYQFHWHNPGYRDFEDFLDTLTARRRKEIRRERRQARDSGVEIEVLDGHQATEEHWLTFSRFYRSTFERKWGLATLTPGFFLELGRSIPNAVVLVLARHTGRYVGAALNLAGSDTLYGRHWGCEAFFPGVHFEVCYYRTIEHCIARGLRRFEAGAQGEHKIARGFLPTPTYSAHWVADPRFRDAIGRFLERERNDIAEHIEDLRHHSPFKSGPNPLN
jgi:predicted N-acyltransferase